MSRHEEVGQNTKKMRKKKSEIDEFVSANLLVRTKAGLEEFLRPQSHQTCNEKFGKTWIKPTEKFTFGLTISSRGIAIFLGSEEGLIKLKRKEN